MGKKKKGLKMEKDCNTCKHDGHQMIYPSECTGCGADEGNPLKHYEAVNSRVELPVKPACVNCKHLNIENGAFLKDRVELCQNSKIRLYNLTNCDIDIHDWGCTYFESKSV